MQSEHFLKLVSNTESKPHEIINMSTFFFSLGQIFIPYQKY